MGSKGNSIEAASCLKNSGFSQLPKRKLLPGPPLLPKKKQSVEVFSDGFSKLLFVQQRVEVVHILFLVVGAFLKQVQVKLRLEVV